MSLALLNQSMMALMGMNNSAFTVQKTNQQRMALANVSPQTMLQFAANPFSQAYSDYVMNLHQADQQLMMKNLQAANNYAAYSAMADGYKKAKESWAKSFNTFA